MNGYEVLDYEVLRFHLDQIVDQDHIRLSNIDLETYMDHHLRSMVLKMEAKILALPEEKIVINEKIYNSWWDHLLATFKIMRSLFGEPKFREIKINQQIYGDVKIDVPVGDDRSYYRFVGGVDVR